MWLVEALGVDEFRKGVAQRMGLDDLPAGVHVKYDDEWKRRDVIGVHPQKQVCCFIAFCVHLKTEVLLTGTLW